MIIQYFSENTTRVDVVFDSYKSNSIKSTARDKRKSKSIPLIRREIQNRDVPLPQNWSGFINLLENKKALSQFLSISNQLIVIATNILKQNQVLVTAGGYEQIDKAILHQLD